MSAIDLASRLDAERPEVPALKVAEDYVAALSSAVLPKVAAECLAEVIRDARRDRVERERRVAYRQSPAGFAEAEDRRLTMRLKRSQTAERERLLAEDPEEYKARYTLGGAIERYRQDIRGEILSDLGAAFVLPDGRSVTWGSATVIDHTAASNAALAVVDKNLVLVARHEEAIDLIKASGKRCLADVSQVAA